MQKEINTKADRIIKNANIFTAAGDQSGASALVVKDGRFIYVGDESGLFDYEGEVTDLGGRFLMPGITYSCYPRTGITDEPNMSLCLIGLLASNPRVAKRLHAGSCQNGFCRILSKAKKCSQNGD